MIISASRRTDIPAFYSTWFANRIGERYVLVPNPFNPKQISRISLDPAVVDCIVFWTKNPAPMLGRLDRFGEYAYYFHYTLNPYGPDAENNLPPIGKRIETFKRLSEKIGKERVIWRYDPLFVNGKYTAEFHREAFARMAEALKEHTEHCTLGFIDSYAHIRRALERQSIGPLTPEEIEATAASFKASAYACGIQLGTCTSKVDLRRLGIPAVPCVDKRLVERIAGYPISAGKDKNQRTACNCAESIDIGTYESCLNGCVYCYAIKGNYRTAVSNRCRHNPDSPLLIGTPEELDGGATIRERPVKSLRAPRSVLL